MNESNRSNCPSEPSPLGRFEPSEPLPAGFRFGAAGAGIKTGGGLDVGVILSDAPAVAAGLYTTNRLQAAPVVWDAAITPAADACAVVVNAGNANACTGERGLRDVRATAEHVAARIGCRPEQVLVLSTGIIGEFLPMDRLLEGVDRAMAGASGGAGDACAVAEAMRTTDRFRKMAEAHLEDEDGRRVHLLGLAKGAGMIGPNMATMLAVVLTDAVLAPGAADRWLRDAVDRSFHCISVDGHTSTNDTVLLLASGRSGVAIDEGSREATAFGERLTELCTALARQIPADGEGASHLMAITVGGCRTREEARRVAEAVATSPLVKTAVAGADPNWGRIASAAGYAGVPFDPARLRVSIEGVPLFANGRPCPFDAEALADRMRRSFEIRIDLEIGEGKATCQFWASDLTHQYVTINAEYHT